MSIIAMKSNYETEPRLLEAKKKQNGEIIKDRVCNQNKDKQ